MAEFAYKALDANGQFVAGKLHATSGAVAAEQLVALGYVPLSTTPESTRRSGFWHSLLPQARVPKRDVTVLLQDLSQLLRSGLPLDDGLRLLVEDSSGATRGLIAHLRAAIGSGANFAEALESHPATALPELIAMVRSAEATGTLDNALETIAQQRLKQQEINSGISAAIRYPIFLLLVSIAVLSFFLLFVVPQFADVVRDFDTDPDSFVKTIIAISSTLRENGDMILTILCLALAAAFFAQRNVRLRRKVIALFMRLPLIRGVVVLRRTATFCRSLGTLLANGVTLPDALRLMNGADEGNEQLIAVYDRVRRGDRLVDSLNDTNLISPLAARMLRVGEESGTLATIALRCASYHEGKLTEQIERLTSIVGPAAIVVISVVIGTLIVSIMSTLLSINQVAL